MRKAIKHILVVTGASLLLGAALVACTTPDSVANISDGGTPNTDPGDIPSYNDGSTGPDSGDTPSYDSGGSVDTGIGDDAGG